VGYVNLGALVVGGFGKIADCVYSRHLLEEYSPKGTGRPLRDLHCTVKLLFNLSNSLKLKMNRITEYAPQDADIIQKVGYWVLVNGSKTASFSP